MLFVEETKRAIRLKQVFTGKWYRLPYRKTSSILLIKSKENVFSNAKKIAKKLSVKEKYLDLQIFETV